MLTEEKIKFFSIKGWFVADARLVGDNSNDGGKNPI